MDSRFTLFCFRIYQRTQRPNFTPTAFSRLKFFNLRLWNPKDSIGLAAGPQLQRCWNVKENCVVSSNLPVAKQLAPIMLANRNGLNKSFNRLFANNPSFFSWKLSDSCASLFYSPSTGFLIAPPFYQTVLSLPAFPQSPQRSSFSMQFSWSGSWSGL